ncbi:1-phosphatidylinositol 4,5-bisphosphate phosphodiesterase beta-2 [Astyanax mexicanus]|uniref:1-phosphatidylinositol 4,5-bisphosphate phosphodiesterase beta-2 n=1 Tax=Astyanax mexicanus TaxID=7994 RepID=UPI0020CAA6B3|nr:1-phosphatidylinositol 4,5-bisphosphate phosphodiesterase beta-2 [Astyanax mexicanus]
MIRKRYFLKEPEVKDYLIKGERFTKWKEDSSRTSHVTMKMDPKGFYLFWINQSKELEILDVANIRDTRTGKYAKLPKQPKVRNVFNMDFPDSNHLAKAFTIVSGLDMVNLTYHNFFAAKDKVVQNWADDILAIAYNAQRANVCRQIFLDKLYVRLSLHTHKDGKIPVKLIYKMFPADKKRVESALAAAHLPKGKFDHMKPDVFTEASFKTFLINLCPRPEIYEIFTSYSTKPYMTKENFTKFLHEKQRDSRLNDELYPPLRSEQVKALIEKYETSSNANRSQISPEGLLYFLMGPETSPVVLDKLAQCHDMTQPVPHYFVKSSHNTYLTAGQFSGVSSPEMYRQCLLAGCRCLELDCWKGKPPEEEPIITHGFTMTTEILFKDVIEAIAESAFKTSKYPIILSFENHVDSVKQQEKMANYCKTIFGDALLTEPLEKYPLKPGQQIPSPAELMGKILIKNKKNSEPQAKAAQSNTKKAAGQDQQQTASSSSDPNQTTPPNPDNQGENTAQPAPAPTTGEVAEEQEEQEPEEEQDEEKMKNSDEGTAGQEVTAYEAMSSLVNYIQPNKFISFENAKKKNKSYVISSFVETKGESLISKTAVEFVEYNKRQMSRIYPKGTRMDSSNYNPQPFWNAGCQMVALNYQTLDFPMQLNLAMFEYNGRTGYLLKHDLLRRNDKKFDPFSDRIDTIVANTLTIKIYSGQFLADKNVKTLVEVEIIGLPGDPKRKYRTKPSPVPNAINPVWNEEPFVFEKILCPDMASLRIVAFEEGGKFIGHRIIPIDAIQSGFHHICLRSECNIPLTMPALFVYIEVKDYIPAAFADFTDALFNPVKSTKPAKQESATYVSPYELPPVPADVSAPAPAAEPDVSKIPAEGAADPPKENGSSPPDSTDTDPPSSTPEPTDPENQNTADQKPEAPELQPNAENPPAETPAAPVEPDPPAETSSAPEDEPTVEEPEVKPDPPPVSDSTPDTTPDSELNSTEQQDSGLESASATDSGSATEAEELPDASTVCDGSEPPSSVTCAELQEHKSFVKVTKRQEREMKELEKKFQKKAEELSQKYSDLFKSIKKKTSLKKKEAGAEKADAGPSAERVTDLKQKMQAELRALWVEQYDQLRKKKEQHATERVTKLLEMATERHCSETKALTSESKEGKKKESKCKLKKGMSCEQLDEENNTEPTGSSGSLELEKKLRKKQADTLADIRAKSGQLHQEAMSDHAKRMWSLPCDLREAVNACVSPHFPDQVEKGAERRAEHSAQGGHYGHVFLG